MEISSRTGSAQQTADRQIALWLFGVAALIFIMVLVGGLTRLTESGLSITEWKPVTGSVPPLSEAQWQAEFDKYRQIPEYQLINKGMSLADFKKIFWWEWAHRFLGRLIGFVFLVPFLWFAARKQIQRALLPKLALMFVLGGLQGVVGWWMVKSGLTHRTDVSQYRLVAHLSLALLIYCYIVWVALGLWRSGQVGVEAAAPCLRKAGYVLLGLIFLQMMLGGFVAGLNAGFTYNSWPLMDGAFIPSGLFAQSPWWLNFFENVMTVQFQHRMVAYLVVVAVFWHWLKARKSYPSATALFHSTMLQVALGIWTLLAVVPISLGAAHQFGALVVLTMAVIHARKLTGFSGTKPSPL